MLRGNVQNGSSVFSADVVSIHKHCHWLSHVHYLLMPTLMPLNRYYGEIAASHKVDFLEARFPVANSHRRTATSQ